MAIETRTPITVLNTDVEDYKGTSYTRIDLKHGDFMWSAIVDESVPEAIRLINVIGIDDDNNVIDAYRDLTAMVLAKLYPAAKSVVLSPIPIHDNFDNSLDVVDLRSSRVVIANNLRDDFDKSYVIGDVVKTTVTLTRYELIGSVLNPKRIGISVIFGEDNAFSFIIDKSRGPIPIVTSVSKVDHDVSTKYCQYLAAILVPNLLSASVSTIGIDGNDAQWVNDESYRVIVGRLAVSGDQRLITINATAAYHLFNELFILSDGRGFKQSEQPESTKWWECRHQQQSTGHPQQTIHKLRYEGNSRQLLDFTRTLPLALVQVIANDYYFASVGFPTQPMYQQAPGNFYSPQLTPTVVITLLESDKL